MVTLDEHVTARPQRDGFISWTRTTFPFVPVVLPWIVARVLLVPVLTLYTPNVNVFLPGRLLAMDGGWFRAIAINGYDRNGGTAEYPFFPLFPAIGGFLMKLGVPTTVALAGLAWVGALFAMAGARILAQRHLSAETAALTPWVIALAPGALSLVLGYSDSFYLAGLIWAVVLVEDRRWWLAGLLAAVATASRPNGAIAVVAVVVIAVGLRATIRQFAALVLPSVAFIAGWMFFLWRTKGDPLLFWTAKSQWIETTLVEFLSDPLHQRLALVHLGLLVIYLAPYLIRFRRFPPAWAVVVALGVLPALVLGVVGTARYAILAFPLPIAAADVLADQPRWVRVVALTASAIALMVFARLVVAKSWVP
ncbi:MAG: hypothetical protein ACOYL9_01240 [Ilumatobacteraceae bacterium]